MSRKYDSSDIRIIDGIVFKSTGHSLGDRTQIVLDVAVQYLTATGERSLRRAGETDFERKESLRYQTTNGVFVISYEQGFPVGRFESTPSPPDYPDHHDLAHWRDDTGQTHAVKTVDDWEIRKAHIRRHLERVIGPLPSSLSRVPLDVLITEDVRLEPPVVSRPILRRKLTYQSDAYDRVSAHLMLPLDETPSDGSSESIRPAVLCLRQTTDFGKDEPVGIRGDKDLEYALATII